MVKGKKFVFVKHFEGEPKDDNLKLVEFDVPDIKDGEILIEAEFLSVDPYMRPYSANIPENVTMIGSQVAKIVESKNPKYPVGKRVLATVGWKTHHVMNPDVPTSEDPMLNEVAHLLPDFGPLSPSLALGVLGMPGNTSYFGFLEICKPKAGETLVVTGAAGAVGSHVGQIGKIFGLKVIGIAGSDAKCKWIVDELGFDHAINYKTDNVYEGLKKAAPNGIDCYFDNVGGELSSIVISQMNKFGRISVCGSISSYNDHFTALPKATILQPSMVFNQLKMEGFIVIRWMDQFEKGTQQNLQWIKEGKLKYRETITKGFENMYKAFKGMLKGENVGKAVVKV